MIGHKAKQNKKQKPKRPVARVLQSVRHVLKISPVADDDAVWTWGDPSLHHLPPKFDLAVWNIWKGSGGQQFLKEYEKIIGNCHLLLCQEALLTLKGLGAYAPTGYQASHCATYKRMDGLRDGVMTISLAMSCSKPHRILCLAPEPILKTSKATLVTKYAIEGGTKNLCVVNTHATLIRRPATAVKELEQVIDFIVGHEGPIIFAGDFNTFSKSYIAEVDRVLSSIHLERIVIADDPRTRAGSLDQIYVRGLEVTTARIAVEYVHSDHFPIIATIAIKDR